MNRCITDSKKHKELLNMTIDEITAMLNNINAAPNT